MPRLAQPVNYPNDRWSARVDASEVQEHFDPSVGFATRRNYRRYTPTLIFSPRPASHPYIRRLIFGGSADIQTDTQSVVAGWQSRFRWILRPGNDLYVVSTHNWLNTDFGARGQRSLSRFATLDKRLASQVLYTYRFWITVLGVFGSRSGSSRTLRTEGG